MNLLQNKKLLLALFVLSALFLMPAESRADVVGVCTDVPGQSGLGACDKRVNITGSVVTITLTNTSPVANGGFITADAFNLAANTTISNFSAVNVLANNTTTPNTNFGITQGVISASPFDNRNTLISTGGDFEGGGNPTTGIGVGQTVRFTFTLGGAGAGANTETSIFTSEFIRFRGFNDGGSDKTMVSATPAAAVPEPTTMLLLGSGLAGVAARIRRRRRNNDAE